MRNHPVIERIEKTGYPTGEMKVLGECAGCKENVLEGEDVYQLQDVDGDEIMIHQEYYCCMEYVAEQSICEVAGK